MSKTTGTFVTVDGVAYYKISHVETLRPFLIQVVSASDLWVFLSSGGGVTAGRKNAQGNLFPYVTDDKLNSDDATGAKAALKAKGKTWQVFEKNGAHHYNITRNLYKAYYANSVMLEEIHHDLQLSYTYRYETSEKYGLVKSVKLQNLSDEAVSVEWLDGLTNLMPYGVSPALEASASTLVDAYKAAEMLGENLAVFSQTTTINDTPNPLEMLKANIAYHTAQKADVYLGPDCFESFLQGEPLPQRGDCYGKKCAYFVHTKKELAPKGAAGHSLVLDSGYTHAQLADIHSFVEKADFKGLFQNVQEGTKTLVNIVKNADGLQQSGDEVACASHYLSTLYNVMRGGTFEEGYAFCFDLFYKFIAARNQSALKNTALLEEIKDCKTVQELLAVCRKDTQFERLALEFMPLSFSRRHGDPSRPWNRFNIALKDENGEKMVHYEGNWRDIFQNWEALGLSYPVYYEHMVAKFVNASTIDGFNPYRLNSEGIEWEKPEPDNPFSGLGYWGDHQIIYLLRLLQGLSSHFPKALQKMLTREIFSYANVPYRLRDYSDVLKDSKNTIVFDRQRDEEIERLSAAFGMDAKLVLQDGEVYTANLAEKLLVPALSKLCNLLPGGGIWMNTQRPEWNDANNAIVGIGLSMVTVYHLKAYLAFLQDLFAKQQEDFRFSKEVFLWLQSLTQILQKYEGNYKGNEKAMLDEMCLLFFAYHRNVYENGFSEKVTATTKDVREFLNTAQALVAYTIGENKGDVYVSYNLLCEDFSIKAMKTMLEGQSAIIGSGGLAKEEVCRLIKAMRASLYNEEEGYHTLYPVQKTRKFFKKNTVQKTFSSIEGVLEKDANGALHFDARIENATILKETCEKAGLTSAEIDALLLEYERVFGHKKFNGRSDVMYKFEGIGCVYWHQNAKFALGILETAQRAHENGEDIQEIYADYNALLQGFVYRKSPAQCGVIPIEPYSHTSFNKTAEQPGMTGQVKESILMRRGELGVRVSKGRLRFEPFFLRESEFCQDGTIRFACYGTPCIYKKSTQKGLVLHTENKTVMQSGYSLSEDDSLSLFERRRKILQIEILI